MRTCTCRARNPSERANPMIIGLESSPGNNGTRPGKMKNEASPQVDRKRRWKDVVDATSREGEGLTRLYSGGIIFLVNLLFIISRFLSLGFFSLCLSTVNLDPFVLSYVVSLVFCNVCWLDDGT